MSDKVYAIILSEEARQDEIESYLYYEIQRPGLGEEFLDALESCYSALRSHPFSFSFIDRKKDIRDVKIKRFPFVIIFEVSGSNVFVYSVHNTNRFPFHKK